MYRSLDDCHTDKFIIAHFRSCDFEIILPDECIVTKTIVQKSTDSSVILQNQLVSDRF